MENIPAKKIHPGGSVTFPEMIARDTRQKIQISSQKKIEIRLKKSVVFICVRARLCFAFSREKLVSGLSCFLCVKVGRIPGFCEKVYFSPFSGGSFWRTLVFFTGATPCGANPRLLNPRASTPKWFSEKRESAPGCEKAGVAKKRVLAQDFVHFATGT